MWYVLYTKPRAEKKVAQFLNNINLEVYCPMVTEVRRWSDRKKKVNIPLFTSYVFVNLREHERPRVFDVPGVVRFLSWLGKPVIIKDSEIEVIKNWINAENIEEIKIEHLAAGDRINIPNGSFKDEEAIIQDIGPKRVRLMLLKLGCTVNIRTRDIVSDSVYT